MSNIIQARDWRLPENRLEAFSRIYAARSVEGDLDHHHTGKVITDMLGMDNDNKALYAMIFGQSYRNHVAMITMQTFPDLLNTPDEVLQEWHNRNWQRMKYSKDTKWGLKKFPAFIKSIKSKIGNGSLYQYLGDLANQGNTRDNYYRLNRGITEFYGIGRMTGWLAQQTLYEFFDWDIDHWDQQLYDRSGTWSQFKAMCYLFNREDLCAPEYKVNDTEIRMMEENTVELLTYMNKRIPFHADVYNFESVECEYRKTAQGNNGKPKEFTFWTSNELADQYQMLKNHWSDYNDIGGAIDWKPYVTGLMAKGPALHDYGYHTDYFKVVMHQGMNLNTHHLYKDEPNAHVELDLFKAKSDSIELLDSDWDSFYTKDQQTAVRDKYRPVQYLKWKDADHPSWKDPNLNLDYLRQMGAPVPVLH
jgi:hypothetical protein